MTASRVEMLRDLPFLEGAEPAVLHSLAADAVERRFRPGDVVLAEGTAGREIYLILEGAVEVIKGRDAEQMFLARRGPGDLFGEMALLEEQPRFATIRAVEPTRLLEFSEATMRAALARQPDLLYRTVRLLSARLRQADLKMIVDLQQKNRELARAYRELQAAQAALVEKERLERELELARDIQQSILPRQFPRLPGFHCAARSFPARHVGGDFYDVIHLGGQQVGLVMADVSGKGISAALFMALTRSLVRAEARRDASPRRVLLNVHHLLREVSDTGLFVTVFYGVLDLARRTLSYARAGHDRPLAYRPLSGHAWFLPGDGMALGLVDPVHLEEISLPLEPGDLLILYSDGITDARAAAGQFFGDERLVDTILSAGQATATGISDAILSRVQDFQSGADQFDDMALLVACLDAVS